MLAGFLHGCQVGYIDALNNSPELLQNVITPECIKTFHKILYSGSFITVIFCFALGHSVGRKKTLLGAVLVYTMCWLAILTRPSLDTMFACLYLYGIASGIIMIIGNLYTTEIASPKNREILLIMYNLAVTMGKTSESTLWRFESHSILALFPLSVSIITMLMAVFTVETPYYLVSVGLEEAALSKLCWLNDKPKCARSTSYLRNIQRYVAEERSKRSSLLKQILGRNDLKLILVMIIIKGASRMNSTLFSYCKFITEDLMLRFDINCNTAYVIYNLWTMILTVFSFFTILIFSRRFLLLFGFFSAGVLLMLLSVYGRMQKNYTSDVAPEILDIIMMLAFTVIHTTTYHAALIILLVEIFPYGLKELYTSLCTLSSDSLSVVLLSSYEKYSETKTINFWLAVNSCSCFFCFFCVLLFIKDTKGKSLYEIRTSYSFSRHRKSLSEWKLDSRASKVSIEIPQKPSETESTSSFTDELMEDPNFRIATSSASESEGEAKKPDSHPHSAAY